METHDEAQKAGQLDVIEKRLTRALWAIPIVTWALLLTVFAAEEAPLPAKNGLAAADVPAAESAEIAAEGLLEGEIVSRSVEPWARPDGNAVRVGAGSEIVITHVPPER